MELSVHDMANRDGIEAFEREAARLYRCAGFDPEVGVAPLRLITALLGADAIRWADGNWIRGGGALGKVNGEWRIYLSRRYTLRNIRFVALHELGHWAMPGATEDQVDKLAARLLAPRPAFARAVEATCRDRIVPSTRAYSDLGAWFGCTDSFAAMRHSEVIGTPLALLTQESTRIRGEEHPWPAEHELRKAAEAPRMPGLRKARLRDDPSRVVLRAHG